MKIHEYQAKDILRAHGVPVPAGRVVTAADQAAAAARELGGGRLVVKAQVHAGGRGKAGGIKVVEGVDAVVETVRTMLGMRLKTHQDPVGRLVRTVYLEQAADIERELYLSVVLDRAAGSLCLIGCREGGMEIEALAEEDRQRLAEDPQAEQKIKRVHLPVAVGWSEYLGRWMATELGFDGAAGLALADMCGKLVEVVHEEDASMVEINPLVLLKDGTFAALDAKVGLEDNAAFRHPEHAALRDTGEEDPLEVEASDANLNYIKLDGTIGCMVNGAGLAMATMDIIKLCGGEPANFLDVGGGASAESVATAFRIIQRDENVQAILINIFGGIVKCDLVAQGILDAVKQVDLDMPLVVRLQGTNAEQAMALLQRSDLAIEVAEELGEAARKVVAAARGEARSVSSLDPRPD